MDHQNQPPMSPPPHPAFDRAGPSQELSQVALWSMIIGIVSLCLGPLGVVALIMGIVGITATTGERARRGLGFAIAGTALGVLGILGTCLSVGILLPAIGKARQTAQAMLTETRMRQLQVGVQSYSNDTGEMLPGDNWRPTLSDYLVGTPDDPIFTSPLSDGDAVEYVYVPGDFAFDNGLIMFYEDPDHCPQTGMVSVMYDGGMGDVIPIETLEVELRERGQILQR